MTNSSAPYLSVISIALVVCVFTAYLNPQAVLLKGQSPAIVIFGAAFVVSFVLWLMVKGRKRVRGPLAWFLVAMSVAWLVHILVTRAHNDLFNYTALLYVPILLMIYFKPPSANEGWTALIVLGWSASAVLVLTRLLEILGVLQVMYVPQWIIDLEKTEYWLPLSGYLGLDGRWPGPFGHNGTTAMVGALLVVLAFARWTKSSPVFLIVGILTLLLTGGRASVGAAVLGVVVVAIFSRSGRWGRVPMWPRVLGGLAFVALAAVAMLSGDAGASGRQLIWPSFIDLWRTSVWIGVGASGINSSGGVTEHYGHAHNMYIDELARYGLAGFVAQFVALGIGGYLLARAALRGIAGPLALIAAFLVTALTEPRNDWIHPSVTAYMAVLAITVAAVSPRTQWVSGNPEGAALMHS